MGGRFRFAEAALALGILVSSSGLAVEAEFLDLISRSREKAGTFAKPLPDVLPYFVSKEFHPVWTRGAPPEGALVIPDFRFVDQKGRVTTGNDMLGKASLAVFFFASCADYCPAIIQRLKTVQEAFANEERLVIFAHSVTPDIDTPERLAEYAERHGLDGRQWRLLTGDRRKIYEIARESYYADTKVGDDPDREFIHSDTVYLLDGERRIRGIYRATSKRSMNELKADLRLLLGTPARGA